MLAHAVVDVVAGDSLPGATAVWCLVRVPLEPVRSAEPPIRPGNAGTSFSSTFCEATRVAIFGGVAANSALISAMAAGKGLDRAGVDRIAQHRALSAIELARPRLSQALRAAAPRDPAARHAASDSVRQLERRDAPSRASRARP